MIRQLTLLALSAAAPAVAQTQAQLNAQAAAAYRRADTALNIQYGAARNQARADAPAAAALLASQRTWLAYRDAECRRVGQQYAGGSMRPMQELGCKAELTRLRIRQLKGDPR